MALSFSNFVRTTLRSPVTTSDTTLLLETGSGALFNVASGDYFYITVNDGSTVEVMKYTSAGAIVNDTINVARAQDGTTAKAFPAGSCVQVAWNKQQVADFITQVYNDLFDAALIGSDTIVVTSAPSASPPGGVFFAVRLDTRQLWYWDINTVSWYEIGSVGQGIVVVTSPPVTTPAPNVRLAVNTSDNTLYYWNNSAWILLGGGGSSGISGEEIWTRRTGASVVMTPGQTLTSSGFTWVDNIRWSANYAIPSVLSVDGTGRYVTNHDVLIDMMVSINAEVASPVQNSAGSLVITSDDPTLALGEWGDSYDFDAGQSQRAVIMTAQTSAVRLAAGRVFDFNLIYDGSSVGNLTVNRIFASLHVTAQL